MTLSNRDTRIYTKSCVIQSDKKRGGILSKKKPKTKKNTFKNFFSGFWWIKSDIPLMLCYPRHVSESFLTVSFLEGRTHQADFRLFERLGPSISISIFLFLWSPPQLHTFFNANHQTILSLELWEEVFHDVYTTSGCVTLIAHDSRLFWPESNEWSSSFFLKLLQQTFFCFFFSLLLQSWRIVFLLVRPAVRLGLHRWIHVLARS